jgi:hypothetical protein
LEYLHGIEMFAAPADPPHAVQHAELSFVLRGSLADGHRLGVDMLTRTSHTSDFAPDASIYRSDPDPVTGGRQLEELAFEIASKQAMRVPTEKARELVRRGVRRVFCILVKQRRMLEWSRETDGWRTMPDNAVIEDRCLLRPIPVRALLSTTEADEAVAEALVARGTPAIERVRAQGEASGRAQGEADGRAQGEASGRANALLALLAARGIAIDDGRRSELIACSDLSTLDRWIARAAVATSAGEVFGK